MGRGGKLTLQAKHHVFLSSPSHPHFFSCTFNSSPSNVWCLINKRTSTRTVGKFILRHSPSHNLSSFMNYFPFRSVHIKSGSFSNDNGDGNENLKKAISLISKTTALHVHHAFLYISLPSLHNYDMKWPNFTFIWERERQRYKFEHLCLNSGAVPSLQL